MDPSVKSAIPCCLRKGQAHCEFHHTRSVDFSPIKNQWIFLILYTISTDTLFHLLLRLRHCAGKSGLSPTINLDIPEGRALLLSVSALSEVS